MLLCFVFECIVNTLQIFKNVVDRPLMMMVAEYEKTISEVEGKLVAFALEHNLRLSLGDYGNGRTLLLEDSDWHGKERGEWLYSSETC